MVWNIFFSHILGIIIPIDFHIFQRGGPTTNQRWFGGSPIFGETPMWRWIHRNFILVSTSLPPQNWPGRKLVAEVATSLGCGRWLEFGDVWGPIMARVPQSSVDFGLVTLRGCGWDDSRRCWDHSLIYGPSNRRLIQRLWMVAKSCTKRMGETIEIMYDNGWNHRDDYDNGMFAKHSIIEPSSLHQV